MITLRFDQGTLLLVGLGPDGGILAAELTSGVIVWDPRVAAHRAHARCYARLLRAIHGKAAYEDHAKRYDELALREHAARALRPYQREALAAWVAARRQGVVVLPTGAGKSYVALKAILECQRSALVLAPTIDLVVQWQQDLSKRLGIEVGQYGGGEKRLAEVTVATYDSALLFMPSFGDRFGLIVFDECHHLPAGATRICAEACLAPFRLGLTATPERADGGHALMDELIGVTVHRTGITELEGNYLANYEAEIVEVALDPDEAASYAEHRRAYLSFARMKGVDFSRPDGWQQFLSAAARDPQGRAAFRSYREQRRISRSGRGKVTACWDLLRDHAGERCLVFTEDNGTAYHLGRTFVLPVLTHHTRPAERKAMLTAFRSGRWPVLVTSKVLNEGVDVPEASVGIIVSGSGSIREHVQRLGRILRPQPGKRAVLYEILTAGTGEGYTSERRRNHAAFGNEGLLE